MGWGSARLRDSWPGGTAVPKNRYLLGLAIVAFAIGFVEAVGFVELPFGSWFSAVSGSILSSATLNNFMTSYGYASVFALMALESASLPVPSEVVLPLAGFFVAQGTMNFWVVIAVSTVASLFGALVDYFLAKWLGRPFVAGLLGLFKLHKDLLDRAEAWFDRSAQWTVFVARFVPGLRTAISLPAGLFEMDFAPFVYLTVLGCFLWSVVLVYAGTLVRSAPNAAFASPAMIDGLSAIIAAVSAAYIVYFFAHRPAKEEATPPSSAP